MISALLAATLLLHVTRGGETRALDIALGHPSDEASPTWTIHRRLAPHQSSLSIPDLDRGAWIVLVRGPESMQRITAKIVVAENDKRRLDIALHPRRLHARVLAGVTPVANAEVHFDSLEDGWDGFAKTDANGFIDASMWIGGDFEVIVHRTPEAVPIIRIATLHGGDAVTTINMPDHVIRGVVTDLAGMPVANGNVVIRTKTDQERTAGIRAKTDAQGRFAFDAVDTGTHQLRPYASGFLLADAISVTVGDNERVHDVRLTLSPGYQRDVIVRTHDGEPVADASIVCATSTRVRGKAFTDERGHAIVPTPADESSVLYVIPSDGSLAIHRLSAAINETSSKAIEIVMPSASASLQIDAKTSDGKPMRDLSFLMRFDGEVIPPSIAKEGLLLRTTEHGEARLEHIPPGVYELWPYQDQDDVADLLETIGIAAAPININVTTGENRAAIRFRSR